MTKAIARFRLALLLRAARRRRAKCFHAEQTFARISKVLGDEEILQRSVEVGVCPAMSVMQMHHYSGQEKVRVGS